MESKNKLYYHYHRLGTHDDVWDDDKIILVDDNFNSYLWESLINKERELKTNFSEYDLDLIIEAMENVKSKEKLGYDLYHKLDFGVNGCYMLRRELALEEGRKLYNSLAPSRLHTIYLTDMASIGYWYRYLGGESIIYEVEALGDVFESSDYLFPDIHASMEKQVEDSKKYWQPKKLAYGLPREYLFKGNLRIKKERDEL